MEPLHVPVDSEETQSKAVLKKSAGTPGPQIGLVIVDDGSDWVGPECGNINLPSRAPSSAPETKAVKPKFPANPEDMKVEDPEKSKNWELREDTTDEKEKKASALDGISTVAQPQKALAAGEWTCKSCGNLNHASRRFCSACYRERAGAVESFDGASANGQNGGAPMWRCQKCHGANFAHELVCPTPGCLTPAPTGGGATRPHAQANVMDTRDLYRMNGRGRDTSQQRLKRGNPGKKQGGRRDGSGGIGEKRAGWYCERCNNFNFEGRLFCNIRTCRAPPPAPSSRRQGASGRLPDDRKGWVCVECGNFNYESRKVCNMRACRAPRPQSVVSSQGAFPPKSSPVKAEAEAEGGGQNPSPATEPGWDCPRCGNYNFHGRKLCNMRKCREPRPENPELRHSTSPRRSGGSRRDTPGVRRDDGGGKLGWTCEECGNFNFDTRRICNRRTCRVPRPPGARMWKRKSDTGANGAARRRHRGSPPDQPRYLSTDAGFPPEMAPRAPPPALPGRSGRWVWYEGGDAQESYYPSDGRSAPEGGLRGGGSGGGNAGRAMDLARMDVRFLRGRGAGPVSDALPPPLQLRNSNRAGWGAGSGGVVQRSGGEVIRSPVVGSGAIMSEPSGSFYRFAQGRGSPSIQEMALEEPGRGGGEGGGSSGGAIGEGNNGGSNPLSGGGAGGLGSGVKVYYPSFKENTNLSVI
mmetsp:Transcript_34912/g.64638  ORF Transcript_34912/g.64638 Transcript_34912/m.64638 type:complete len:694 (-) Transcript_34912:543-2624(-)